MQMVVIEADEHRAAIFTADLCPTTAHLRPFWTMAYDQFLLDVRRKKPPVFHWAVQEKATLLFEHDPRIWAATIRVDDRQQFAVDSVFEPCVLWSE
jgi:hypothetical protein